MLIQSCGPAALVSGAGGKGGKKGGMKGGKEG